MPQHLPFRDEQITSVAQVLSPLLRASRPSNLLIYGKTGTGKTAATRHVISKLETASKNAGIQATFVYSNVRIAGTEYRVLADLASQTGLSVPFTGLAVSEVLARLQSQIKNKKLRTVFVLDEIDYLVKSYGDGLLYDLTTSSDAIAPGFLSIIGISNDLQFKEELGARVLSRLSEEEIVFPPYSVSELTEILHERASFAFNSGAYTDAAINLCAALSGFEHGDARRAVDLLRIAGEVAERDGSKQLDDKHVRIALQKIDQDRVSEALRSLPLHAKLVLIAAVKSGREENGKKSTGTIYEHYSGLCKNSGHEMLTARRVSGIVSELDTLGLVSATLVNYGRYGRTKKVTPQISADVLRLAFQDDSSIVSLLES